MNSLGMSGLLGIHSLHCDGSDLHDPRRPAPEFSPGHAEPRLLMLLAPQTGFLLIVSGWPPTIAPYWLVSHRWGGPTPVVSVWGLN